MSKKFYYILLTVIILGIMLFVFGIINTMVSLKYETNNPGDCISVVTGSDLCSAIRNMRIYLIISVAIMIGFIFLRKKIIK